MTDPTPTPTPTNEQQDVRERGRHTDDFDACPVCSPPVRETVGMVCQGCGTDYAKDDARTIAWNTWIDDVGRHMGSRTRDLMSAFDAGWAARDVQPTPLAAVSAAAPDERWWESLVQAECDAGHVIFVDDGDGTVYACPACALAEARAALAARPAPAVNAAAPDERVCYSDECGEPCQSWQAMKRAEIEHLRRENATIAQRLGEARAVLAARRAPVVGGEARTPDESCISGAAERAGAAADDEGAER